jgi:hypothetical protein
MMKRKQDVGTPADLDDISLNSFSSWDDNFETMIPATPETILASKQCGVFITPSTSPPESQTAHTSKLSATDSLSIAIPPKSSKVARTRSEEVAEMRGPFPNPIELSVISKYRDEQYKESGVFDGPVSGLPPVESSEMVFLQVGDVLISEDPEKRESSYVVYDFRKNAVVVDFKVTEENTLNAADFDKGWYFRQRRMQDGSVNTKRIKSSRYLAVRRDPEKTTANIQVVYGKFKERMNLINPTVDLPPPIQVRGAGGIDDFPLCSLREVPDTSATPSASALQMPDLASFAPLVTAGSRKIPCFFCNEPIFLPIPISAWHIDLPIADSRDRHRCSSFRDHCSSNHPQMPLWTMVANAKNTFLAGDSYLLKDHVQKCLSQAVCSNPIPYELFLSVMLGNDVPLRYHFGVLFGFTRGAVTYADTVRKLKCHKPPNRGTKAKVEDLSASAERKTGVSGENNMQPGYTKGEQVKNTQKFKTATMNVLEKIEKCFEKFNFQELGSFFSVHESFVKSGKKTEQQALLLWNVVNLFFCRGLYMEPPFPPLLHLGPIESTDYSGDAASVDDSQLIEWSELTLDALSNPNGNV